MSWAFRAAGSLQGRGEGGLPRVVAAEVERSGQVTEKCRGRIHRVLSLITGRGPEWGKESWKTLGFCWLSGSREHPRNCRREGPGVCVVCEKTSWVLYLELRGEIWAAMEIWKVPASRGHYMAGASEVAPEWRRAELRGAQSSEDSISSGKTPPKEI